MRLTVVRSHSGSASRHQTFELPDIKGASVSNVLQYINRHLDGSVGYYLSCRRGLCVACVVKVNGKNETGCVFPAADGMVIEPIRTDLLVKDTVVDLSMAREAVLDLDPPAGC